LTTLQQPIRTPRRRALVFALAAIAVLVAGVLPACAIDCCMSQPAQTSIHRSMPCCGHDSSIAPRIDSRMQPVASAGPLVPPSTVVAHAVTPAVPDTTSLLASSNHAAGGSPPLFLICQQFLI
jgi:hypothetical protein